MKPIFAQKIAETKKRLSDRFAGGAELQDKEEIQNIRQENPEKNESKEIPTFPATLQFFAIYQKDKPILVLPCYYNDKFMTTDELGRLKLFDALSGHIIIPSTPEPWSKITENSDHLFLTMQSRKSWGIELHRETNLFHVDSILKLVLSMQQSLNNLTFRRDLLGDRYNPKVTEGKTLVVDIDKPIELKEKILKKEEPGNQGIVPGQNWNV